jgi:hypothetical protein
VILKNEWLNLYDSIEDILTELKADIYFIGGDSRHEDIAIETAEELAMIAQWEQDRADQAEAKLKDWEKWEDLKNEIKEMQRVGYVLTWEKDWEKWEDWKNEIGG